MKVLRNLFANWHAEREFHVEGNLYAMANPMEVLSAIGFLKMAV
jgi:hypothetical protein